MTATAEVLTATETVFVCRRRQGITTQGEHYPPGAFIPESKVKPSWLHLGWVERVTSMATDETASTTPPAGAATPTASRRSRKPR